MFGPACTVPVDYIPLRLSPGYLYTSLLQCLVVTVTVVSSAPKASWVVVMYTMNNHTYNAMRESDNRLAKQCIKIV